MRGREIINNPVRAALRGNDGPWSSGRIRPPGSQPHRPLRPAVGPISSSGAPRRVAQIHNHHLSTILLTKHILEKEILDNIFFASILRAWGLLHSRKKVIDVTVASMNGSHEKAHRVNRECVQSAKVPIGTSHARISALYHRVCSFKKFGEEGGIRTLGWAYTHLRFCGPLHSTALPPLR